MKFNEWWGVDIEAVNENDNDLWSENKDYQELAYGLLKEVITLRNAIRAHRDMKGDDRCRLDDVELYGLLPETNKADFTLPLIEEFLASCARYCAKRQPPRDN